MILLVKNLFKMNKNVFVWLMEANLGVFFTCLVKSGNRMLHKGLLCCINIICMLEHPQWCSVF